VRHKEPPRDKLVIIEDYAGYRVAWQVYSENIGEDIGGHLDVTDFTAETIARKINAAAEPAEFDELEHEVACSAASTVVEKLNDARVTRTSLDGFRFERKSDAQKVLTAAKAAVAALRERAKQVAAGEVAWPMWAHLAKAEGWTPPKGWKP
jgi:hypothetical protein